MEFVRRPHDCLKGGDAMAECRETRQTRRGGRRAAELATARSVCGAWTGLPWCALVRYKRVGVSVCFLSVCLRCYTATLECVTYECDVLYRETRRDRDFAIRSVCERENPCEIGTSSCELRARDRPRRSKGMERGDYSTENSVSPDTSVSTPCCRCSRRFARSRASPSSRDHTMSRPCAQLLP